MSMLSQNELSSSTRPDNPAQLKRVLDQLEDLGADEVHLIPTSDDVDQVARIADLIA